MKLILTLGLLLLLVFGFSSIRSVSNAKDASKEVAKTAFDGAPLTKLEVQVTQFDGTERPFQNTYWDHKASGIYVDVISGVALFSSTEKYKSGTGWPSFTKPLSANVVTENTDYKLGYPRTEVRGAQSDAHLGHVFRDGPEPTGLRYCMNSAAMRFIPKAEMAEKGYSEFLNLFEAQISK